MLNRSQLVLKSDVTSFSELTYQQECLYMKYREYQIAAIHCILILLLHCWESSNVTFSIVHILSTTLTSFSLGFYPASFGTHSSSRARKDKNESCGRPQCRLGVIISPALCSRPLCTLSKNGSFAQSLWLPSFEVQQQSLIHKTFAASSNITPCCYLAQWRQKRSSKLMLFHHQFLQLVIWQGSRISHVTFPRVFVQLHTKLGALSLSSYYVLLLPLDPISFHNKSASRSRLVHLLIGDKLGDSFTKRITHKSNTRKCWFSSATLQWSCTV